MKLNFTKMQAQGNDYLYFDFRGKTFPILNLEKFAVDISDRHFGVGADGIVLILDDAEGDAFMRIFNADGSEALMCGSALRSVAYLLHEEIPTQHSFIINTLSGLKRGSVLSNNDIKVNLGVAKWIEDQLENNYTFSHINIGNPHFICFADEIDLETTRKVGKQLEEKYGANIEFAKIISPSELNLQVWERGSGITLACGTGSGATVYAGIRKSLLENKVRVNLLGGTVLVEFENKEIFLSGPVTKVFSADWNI